MSREENESTDKKSAEGRWEYEESKREDGIMGYGREWGAKRERREKRLEYS